MVVEQERKRNCCGLTVKKSACGSGARCNEHTKVPAVAGGVLNIATTTVAQTAGGDAFGGHGSGGVKEFRVPLLCVRVCRHGVLMV